MSQIEQSIPICESLIETSNELEQSWLKLTRKEMKANEFRELSKNVKDFLETANKNGETLKTHLNEVLMAQDFQDITGQVIFKVIKLVEDVEAALVNIVKIASEHMSVDGDSDETVQDKAEKDRQTKTSLDGPVVPGVSNEKETVSGQDEVDDLLSSLGF